MSSPIQIKKLSSVSKGYRILVSEKPPEKHWFGKFIDVWVPELAPSEALRGNHRAGKIKWEDFAAGYKQELLSSHSQDLLKPLALLSLRRTLVLICACPDSRRCPETLLAQRIEECKENRNFVLSNLCLEEKEGEPMNIINFLIEDHNRLRRDRVAIHKSFPLRALMKEKIKRYIADLELHETIEHKYLIQKLQALPAGAKLSDIVDGYEREHQRIWSLLNELLDKIETREFSTLQQTFFEFFAFVEAHVRAEERTFFPTIRKLFDENALRTLGQKVQKDYVRYHDQMERRGKPNG